MTNALYPDNDAAQKAKIKRHTVSDADGTREGGLIFVIVFILGFIAATVSHPAAITSFWVWCVLITMAMVVAVGAQKAIARLYGHEEDSE
ncbi:MAG: hypothetical protein AAFQ19_00995 [Pseudomonadota bacterium]